MFHLHVHLGGHSHPAPEAGPLAAPFEAQAIGDGKIIDLIAKYGPALLKFLIAFGIIKLPPGVTLPFEAQDGVPAGVP